MEDALDIEKIRLFLVRYERGKGASATVWHYLDLADARVLAADLSRGGLQATFQDYKGSPTGREGKPISRVLKLEDRGETRAPIVLEISNGPGEVVGEGRHQAGREAGRRNRHVAHQMAGATTGPRFGRAYTGLGSSHVLTPHRARR